MTPHTDYNSPIRKLIRSFARIDECFDDDFIAQVTGGTPFQVLNARLEYLLALPVIEVREAAMVNRKAITDQQMRQIVRNFPYTDDGVGMNALVLRERLRDKLYDLLLRIDDCAVEDLAVRRIVVSPVRQLSLNEVQQLVAFMISECLKDFDKAVSNCAENAF